MPWGRRYTKKVRSLTPDFRKKTIFVLLGPNHPHPEKADFVDNFTPFPRKGGTPGKKCHLQSGLNQRDRATAGFGRGRSHGKPNKFFYCRGFGPRHKPQTRTRPRATWMHAGARANTRIRESGRTKPYYQRRFGTGAALVRHWCGTGAVLVRIACGTAAERTAAERRPTGRSAARRPLPRGAIAIIIRIVLVCDHRG